MKETDAPTKVETNCAGDKKNGEAIAAEEDKTVADTNDTGKYASFKDNSSGPRLRKFSTRDKSVEFLGPIRFLRKSV